MRQWVAKRLCSQQESVFEEMNALARRFDAVNLGSGTPDMPVPDFLQSAAQEAIARGYNQYAPVRGEFVLREAVAAHAARFYGQEIDPATEITITSGVTEAIHAAVLGFVDPGDEVIVFEPFYDCYVPSIRMAGGLPVAVTLRAPSFRFDFRELRAAFSPRTKALILNTPHNPTGIVFSREELILIAELCQEFDVIAIADEVYEHIVFDRAQHVRLATLPGMWERTLTLSGAGKTFSCTGWRIGWAIGPARLHDALCLLRQFTVFSSATPFQIAIASGLHCSDSYFQQLVAAYETRRDFLMHALAASGLKPTRPAGSFFILTDISSFPYSCGHEFCTDLAQKFGVVPVPMDTFYLRQDHGRRDRTIYFLLATGSARNGFQATRGTTNGVLGRSMKQVNQPTSEANLTNTVRVGVGQLSIEDVVRVARDRQRVSSLAHEVAERVQATAAWVASTVEQISLSDHVEHHPVAYYGINTGFGALAGRSALDSTYLTKVLGRNLIASHSVGVGPYFDEAVVRGVLLIRAQSLAQGYSGVRPLIIATLLRMLNERVYPAVPEQGSLGASGDLAPLAHLLLVLCKVPTSEPGEFDLQLDATDGEAFVPCVGQEAGPGDYLHIDEQYATGVQNAYRRVPGAEAMARVGGKIELQAREALALCNGSTFSAAIAALVVRDAQNLLDHVELAVAMTLEGIRGFRDPFYPHLHRARGHSSAEQVASRVLRYVDGSQLVDPGDLRTNPERVPPQDPYSIRCAPQVLGTVADTLELARRWVEMDINAATDNPLIFLDLERDYKTMSGGNFHGEPIAMAMDFLGIALTDLGNMSERRMFMLNDYYTSRTYKDPENPIKPEHGLNGFLIDEPNETAGLNSGLMMLQATAAALVSDCKALAHPDSIDSIPSSGNQEDHVSMSLNAARHAREIVKNLEHILALEFLCAAQAIALQLAKHGNRDLRLGKGTHAALVELRAAGVAMLTQDRVLYPDIRKAIRLVRSGSLLKAARAPVVETSTC